MKKHIIKLLITAFMINILFITGAYAATPSNNTINLEEDWRLTGALDITAGDGNTITIDGQNKYTIYEMNENAILTNSTGTVRLKDVRVINYGSEPEKGSLAELEKFAATITGVQAPAKDATALTLPVLESFSVTIASSSNQAVIATNGTITPLSTDTTVSLVLDVAGNGGIISTKSFPVAVPAKTGNATPTPTPSPTASPTVSPTPSPTPGDGAAPVDAPKVTPGIIIAPTPVVDTASGNATTTLDSKSITDAAAFAVADSNGIKTITVEIKKTEGTTSNTVQIPKDILNTETLTQKIQISTDLCTLEVPGNMLSSMNTDGKNTVALQIGAVDKTKLDAAVRDVIGDRPVIELSVKLDNTLVAWSNQDAPVAVSIPYVPTAEELANPENIVVWYIDGSGKAVSVPNGKYDPVTGTVTFKTTHFSKYALVYVFRTFADIGKYSWAKHQIEVLASKGIINGTSGTLFSPSANITRADYLVLLVKTLDLTADFNTNFNDIKKGDYYYEAVGIAKKLGISSGAGNNMFYPKTAISRQDMMVLTERALKIAQKTCVTGSASDLSNYSDRSKISGYAVDSIAALVKEKLIVGSGNVINPLGNTTWAETAVFLYRIYNK